MRSGLILKIIRILFRYADNASELCMVINNDDMSREKNQIMQRYVSLLTNSGFKAVFGDRANKDVVMSVINILLPEGKQVDDIEYMPTEHQGPTQESKEFQYDFMCTGIDGTAFIVEMQCYPDDFWFRRCVSYASRAYDMQNRKGEEYDVSPVYLIGLMGTGIKHADESRWVDRYVSEYTFREKETNELQDETIFIIFAELARFDKELNECSDDLERMLYIIKNGWKLQNQPPELRKEIFRRLLEACEIAAFDAEKRIKYDKDMYDERRRNGELATAKRIGIEEGREEGVIAMLKKMFESGMGYQEISQISGLSESQIQAYLQK